MCGVAGILNLRPGREPPRIEALSRMVSALHHRGPDERGVYRDERCGLGHTRLSIIDAATGQQPMTNEDGTLWVVFNGEIFNYLELREELLGLGHRFRTQSDTEVILHAWEQWEEGSFRRFDGQWAIVLWDTRRQALILSRDPVGIEPLYLCEHDGQLLVASEVRAIFAADPSVPRALDPRGLEQTFTFWSVVPPQGVFRGVFELEPGHWRSHRGGVVRDGAHWEPRFPTGTDGAFAGTVEDASEAVLAALERAAHLRMVRADVPVGSYLSGGLDSSLVAALARRAVGHRFTTFSLRFEDSEYDEGEHQRVMSRHLESEHRELVVTRSDVARVFPEAVAHAERPVLRAALAPMYLLSGLVRDAGLSVVLTGEGADEIFAGYDLFREGAVRRFWARQPHSELRPRLLERLYPYLRRSPVAQRELARSFFGRDLDRWRAPGFAHGTRWRTTAALRRLFSAELRETNRGLDVVADLLSTLPAELPRWSPLAQDQYIEMRTLLAGYLLSSQGDRMLMAHSVEGRFPFLDRRLIELAASLPGHYKLRGLDEKHVLKRAALALVPEAIRARPKQPYRAPDAVAFLSEGAPPWVAELLGDAQVRRAGIFDPAAVAAMVAKCRRQMGAGALSNADNMALVGVLSTQILHERLVLASPSAASRPPGTVIDVLARGAA